MSTNTEQTAPKKATKAELAKQAEAMGITVRRTWTAAQIQAAIDEERAAVPEAAATDHVEEQAAPPAKTRRTKNTVVEIDGYRVRLAAWVEVHDPDGKRTACIRRDAVASLASAQPTKQMRVMTEYALDGATDVNIGWVRNGVKPVAIGKIVAKAMKRAEAAK